MNMSLSGADLPTAVTSPMRQELQTQLQFVNSAGPESSRKPDTKRLIRAHAARAAHSKIRRARIVEYQKSKTSQEEVDEVSAPGPVTLLGSGRIDPFRTYAVHCTAFEHALIDHCKGLFHIYCPHKLAHFFLLISHFGQINEATAVLIFLVCSARAEMSLRCPVPYS
jgi:hypothetical protein